ncbi:ISAs1 family transposase [Oceanisphaera sp. DM8]|uniref:ISAs1 family transposase n=1 Tax=Oceanisphaera pacifica TaxID=2818389 RepID=A0ABS3NJG7_9GAMM|nr:ISAs1 family transposase [Oceanisphaera pacifica]
MMNMISAKQLQKSFAAWMRDCHIATKGEVIAIDGKSLRGTYSKDSRQGIIHMVSAFSAANKVVLGQVKIADKSNQRRLEAAFDDYLKLEMLQREDGDTYSTKEQGHGLVETRLCLVNDELSVLGDIAFE